MTAALAHPRKSIRKLHVLIQWRPSGAIVSPFSNSPGGRDGYSLPASVLRVLHERNEGSGSNERTCRVPCGCDGSARQASRTKRGPGRSAVHRSDGSCSWRQKLRFKVRQCGTGRKRPRCDSLRENHDGIAGRIDSGSGQIEKRRWRIAGRVGNYGVIAIVPYGAHTSLL